MTRLRKVRMQKCLSQKEFARRMNETQQVVSKWENGTSIPRADKIAKIAQALNADLSEIVKCFESKGDDNE